MRNKYTNLGSYVNGCPTGSKTGWMAMVMDDVAAKGINHSAFMSWDRPLLSARTMKMFRTVFAGQLPSDEMIFVGDNGHCLVVAPGGQATEEFVSTGADTPKTTGHLRSATIVGTTVIAVGMQRQVYVRAEGGQWSDARDGLPAYGEGETSGFEAVVAVKPTEVYAAGWHGEIWRFDGTLWRSVDSPTNKIITALGVDEHGTVYGCGRNGLILFGRANTWQVMSEIRCPDDLWSIAAYGAHIFFASLRRMYCITDRQLSLLDFDKEGADSFGVLSLNKGLLWSIGEKDVLCFDGKSWIRVA